MTLVDGIALMFRTIFSLALLIGIWRGQTWAIYLSLTLAIAADYGGEILRLISKHRRHRSEKIDEHWRKIHIKPSVDWDV
jgi:hypothetical protein